MKEILSHAGKAEPFRTVRRQSRKRFVSGLLRGRGSVNSCAASTTIGRGRERT